MKNIRIGFDTSKKLWKSPTFYKVDCAVVEPVIYLRKAKNVEDGVFNAIVKDIKQYWENSPRRVLGIVEVEK